MAGVLSNVKVSGLGGYLTLSVLFHSLMDGVIFPAHLQRQDGCVSSRESVVFCASVLASFLVAIPAGPTPSGAETGAWYDIGHRLIVRIAELRLAPHTVEAVREILAGQDLAEASLWADQIRGERRETAALHFVNIPLQADAYVPARDCPGELCVIAEIQRDERVVADSTASLPQRAEALRFLIHFIGDLHQPLHVSNNGDKGGNLRPVTLLGNSYNLHQVWDGELLTTTGMDESEYFDHLRQKMDSLDLPALEQGTVVDWAMEGHRLARDYAYRLPRGGRLDDGYVKANLPVVDLALIKAGVRLARVLNEALAQYRPAPAGRPSLGPRVYSDRESAAHVGEVATVVGTVVSVHRSHTGNIYLNFGADYPHQTFSAVVLGPHDARLDNLDSLVGKRVGVRGMIKNYKGRMEIVIESADQIVVEP